MTQTYYSKIVISPHNIVVTTQLPSGEQMSVISRGLAENQHLASAIISHKHVADSDFATSTPTQIEQRRSYDTKQATTLVDSLADSG